MLGMNDRTGALRALVGYGFFGFLIPLAAQVHAEQLDGTFPVVLRLGEETFDSLSRDNINHQGPVDNVVLGTRARGTSHTVGKVTIDLCEPGSSAVLVIRFVGRIETATVGQNGPVFIDSRSETGFECVRKIHFDQNQGFVAAPCEVRSQTALHYEGFRPVRKGIGSRLICRVAERRAQDSREEATQIVASQHRARLAAAFDERVNTAVASLNRRVNAIRYAGWLLPEPRSLQVAVAPAHDSLLVGIGRFDEAGQFPSLPPFRQNAAPMELWLHSSVFGNQAERLNRLAVVAELASAAFISRPSADTPLWFVSAGGTGLSPGESSTTADRTPAGWMRLGLGERPGKDPTSAKEQQLEEPRTLTAEASVSVEAPGVPPTAAQNTRRTPDTEGLPVIRRLGPLQLVDWASRIVVFTTDSLRRN